MKTLNSQNLLYIFNPLLRNVVKWSDHFKTLRSKWLMTPIDFSNDQKTTCSYLKLYLNIKDERTNQSWSFPSHSWYISPPLTTQTLRALIESRVLWYAFINYSQVIFTCYRSFLSSYLTPPDTPWFYSYCEPFQ